METTKAATVEMLARDDDWSSPVNRTQSRIARSLLVAGVDPDIIYLALLAAIEPPKEVK